MFGIRTCRLVSRLGHREGEGERERQRGDSERTGRRFSEQGLLSRRPREVRKSHEPDTIRRRYIATACTRLAQHKVTPLTCFQGTLRNCLYLPAQNEICTGKTGVGWSFTLSCTICAQVSIYFQSCHNEGKCHLRGAMQKANRRYVQKMMSVSFGDTLPLGRLGYIVCTFAIPSPNLPVPFVKIVAKGSVSRVYYSAEWSTPESEFGPCYTAKGLVQCSLWRCNL